MGALHQRIENHQFQGVILLKIILFQGVALLKITLFQGSRLLEIRKKQAYQNILTNNYFWRTWDKKEIDLIEEREGKLFGYEFKWGSKMTKDPKNGLKLTQMEVLQPLFR